MASRGADILDYIATQLATINGAGGYHYDLSIAGRIVIGCDDPTPAMMSGMPVICFVGDPSTGTEEGPSLNQFQRFMDIPLTVFVATGDDLPISRAKGALNVAADVDTAMTGTSARRSGGGLFRDCVTRSNTRNGSSLGFKGCGAAQLILHITYTGSL